MKYTSLILWLVVASFALTSPCADAKVKGFKLDMPKASKSDRQEEEMSRGSFMVSSGCRNCNNGYTLSQVAFDGFDKPQSSSRETFFITNNTDRTLSGVTLYVDYRDMSGHQLHKKFVRLSCNIPPGETRIAEIESWDKQRAFFYEKSSSSKNGTPFTVIFDPVALYLRY